VSLKVLPFRGSGGGKPDLAQAGGPDKAKLAQALEATYEVVARKARG
jgi:alanyl-tRNA synthetase